MSYGVTAELVALPEGYLIKSAAVREHQGYAFAVEGEGGPMDIKRREDGRWIVTIRFIADVTGRGEAWDEPGPAIAQALRSLVGRVNDRTADLYAQADWARKHLEAQP